MISYAIHQLCWTLSPDFQLRIDALEIPKGKTTAILGDSGSGKSTLLSLLGRVEGGYFSSRQPESGEIHLHLDEGPVELLGLSERALLRTKLRGPQIGFVFQREGLFVGKSALDNLVWPLTSHGIPLQEAHRRAKALLLAVSLAEERAVSTLSGGERKRLALARALAFEPQVLLLDEPLTGLDPHSLERLRELIKRMGTPGTTRIIVTHQEGDVLSLADHVIFMRQGQVVDQGPRPEKDEAIRAFFAPANADGQGAGRPWGPKPADSPGESPTETLAPDPDTDGGQ